MSPTPPSIAGAAWLTDPAARTIFSLAPEPATLRAVGGAVRDTLLGRPVAEIDFATTLTPEAVTERAQAAGLKVVPTGIDHGTVTVVVGERGFEITTLREDVATDGRHAVVRFGTDWTADARRRDFTINALFAEADGRVVDPLGGYADVKAGRIRFIGDPRQRIVEDRLRILRFFRFNASHGLGAIDPDGLAAAIAERDGLRELSAERIGHEIRRLVVARRAPEIAAAMQEAGILPVVLAGIGYLATFARFAEIAAELDAAPDPAIALAALAVRISDDVDRLFVRLRLSAAERQRMLAAIAAADSFSARLSERQARAVLYRLKAEHYRAGILMAAAWRGEAADRWRSLYALPETWKVPTFPLKGGNLVASGVRPGPTVGALLSELEDWWIAEDFRPDAAALRHRLQQRLAAQQ